MSVIDTLTGKAARDARKDHEKSQVDLNDAVKRARDAFDKMLADKERTERAAKGGK